jgi:hypothetical protein
MELLGDVCPTESRFSQFGEDVGVGARYMQCLRLTYHTLRNRLGRTRWYS